VRRALADKHRHEHKFVWDREGRTIFVADAHRDGRRFVVHADEKLTAFLEMEAAIRECESA
jgi:hypothetical protein